MSLLRPLRLFVCSLLAFAVFSGCKGKPQRQVVLYTSEDQPVAAPILADFEKRTGIHVVIQTDTEATKSAGLAERLIAEKDNPQADVWWSNEAFRTISLADQGVLAPYDSPAAKDIPQKFKDADHRWAGAGIRVRVLAVSDRLPSNIPAPLGLMDLAAPALKGKIAMARPTAGTTGSQVAALYLLWGPEKADAWFHRLRDNGVSLVGGNSVVADFVGQGVFWVGLTDNDDIFNAQANSMRLHQVLPDQQTFGTLPIPGSVGLVTGAQHPADARLLIDHLLSAEVERTLVTAHSAAWTVRDAPKDAKFMAVDYRQVSTTMAKSVTRAITILENR